MEGPEVLINLFPKSDYEKLLFATSYINELKESLRLERIEKGKLKSEVDELKYKLKENLKSECDEIKKLKSEIENLTLKINKLNGPEADEQKSIYRIALIEARKNELYKMLHEQINSFQNESVYKGLRERIRYLEGEINRFYFIRDNLIYKLNLALVNKEKDK